MVIVVPKVTCFHVSKSVKLEPLRLNYYVLNCSDNTSTGFIKNIILKIIAKLIIKSVHSDRLYIRPAASSKYRIKNRYKT